MIKYNHIWVVHHILYIGNLPRIQWENYSHRVYHTLAMYPYRQYHITYMVKQAIGIHYISHIGNVPIYSTWFTIQYTIMMRHTLCRCLFKYTRVQCQKIKAGFWIKKRGADCINAEVKTNYIEEENFKKSSKNSIFWASEKNTKKIVISNKFLHPPQKKFF